MEKKYTKTLSSNRCKWRWLRYLCIQLHDVSHLVPAEAHKAAVVLRAVPPHHDVRLKVGFPLHPVGCGGCPPFGKVSWCMAFSPHMVPGRTGIKRSYQTIVGV